MHVTIPALPFAAACTAAARVVSEKASLPILRNILLEAGDGTLRVAASDLETTLDIHLPAEVTGTGTASVTAKALAELVSKLGNNPLTLTVKGAHLHLACQYGDYTLTGLPGDDYPAIINAATANPCTLEATLLREALSVVASYPDKTATSAGGACVRILAEPGSLLFTAMMADKIYARRKLLLPGFEGQYQALVPVTAVREMIELLKGDPGPATFCADPNQLTLAAGVTKLTTRLIEGGYPNMEKLLGKLETPFSLTLNRDSFYQSVQRLLIVAEPNAAVHRVRLEVTFDEVILTSETTGGKIVETLIPEQVVGEPDVLYLNAYYIQKALGGIRSEQVLLRYADVLASPAGLLPVAHGTEQSTWLAKMDAR